jgi:hypothetical protein
MTPRTMIDVQTSYIEAHAAFMVAEQGYKAELITTGLQAKLDAWSDPNWESIFTSDDQAAHDAIFDKWGMSKASAELDKAERSLLDRFLDALERREPSQRKNVAVFRKHVEHTTRYEPKRQELVGLALQWKF